MYQLPGSASAVIKSLRCLPFLLAIITTVSADVAESRRTGTNHRYPSAGLGSESLFSPVHNSLSYALDSLQLAENFTTDNFDDHFRDVWYRLQHPRSTINRDGGSTRFINREIFPIDSTRFNESAAMVPNYALHLLGGGLVFRKNVEWFRSNQYRYPILASATLAMLSELVQEAIEDDDVIDSDALADIYIFRPVGILLFSSDRVAKFIQRTLEPAIWPKMQTLALNRKGFLNAGISYVYRPPRFDYGSKRLFIYTGLNNLFGMSHELVSGGTLSWGIGIAIKEITSQTDVEVDMKPSAGLFYDRNNSLMWSAILNDAGNSRIRVNIYPRGTTFSQRLGYFLSIDDARDISAGVVYRLPLGAGFSG